MIDPEVSFDLSQPSTVSAEKSNLSNTDGKTRRTGMGKSARLNGGLVALSADGSTAVAGALADNRVTGAAWVHTRSDGVWTPIAAPSPGF